METKKVYRNLMKKYNLEFILKSLLNIDELKPVVIHTPESEFIRFIINGRNTRLYFPSIEENLLLIDESTDSISETSIDLKTNKTETTIIKRKDNTLRIIRVGKCYEPTDEAISYIEEDHQTYSFDKVRKIYNLKNIDLEFSNMGKLLKAFKFITEDASIENITPDKHDTLIVYDNKYMKLIDEDIYIKLNDEEYKMKYEDNMLDFIESGNIKKLKRDFYGC